jgi:hypothetical protein
MGLDGFHGKPFKAVNSQSTGGPERDLDKRWLLAHIWQNAEHSGQHSGWFRHLLLGTDILVQSMDTRVHGLHFLWFSVHFFGILGAFENNLDDK